MKTNEEAKTEQIQSQTPAPADKTVDVQAKDVNKS
jgi:hypothetical protein